MKYNTLFLSLITILLIAIFNVCNGQGNWQILDSVNAEKTYVASSFINDKEGWLADNKAGLKHTTNGGETWNEIAMDKIFLKLNFADSYNGFALDTAAAYRTNDGGVTWTPLELPGSFTGAMYFMNKDTGIISGFKAIYKTTDGGNSWTTISTDNLFFEDYFFTNYLAGIGVASDPLLQRSIWRTTDGGESWSNVFKQTNYFIHSVWFTDENNGCAAGYYDLNGVTHEPVILKTYDGGVTWNTVYRNKDVTGEGQELIDIRFKNDLEGFAISTVFDNVFTTDGGKSWGRTYESETLNIPKFGGLYNLLDGNSELYLSGTNCYVVKWK